MMSVLLQHMVRTMTQKIKNLHIGNKGGIGIVLVLIMSFLFFGCVPSDSATEKKVINEEGAKTETREYIQSLYDVGGDIFKDYNLDSSGSFLRLTVQVGYGWDPATESMKKDVIHSMGQAMNGIAARNGYEGASVTLLSPAGREVGKYTLFGKVKLT